VTVDDSAGRCFLADLMDGAEIQGIKAIAGVDGIEGCDYTLFAFGSLSRSMPKRSGDGARSRWVRATDRSEGVEAETRGHMAIKCPCSVYGLWHGSMRTLLCNS